MKILLKIVIIIVVSTIFSLSNAEKSSLKNGRKIMEKVKEINQPNNELVIISMKLIEYKGKERIRDLKIWTKKDKEGNLKILIKFTGPRIIKGTGLLTIERKNKDADQWLYLPILRKSKRIASNAKTNNFVGTDFTFEDLTPERLDFYNYNLKKTETIDGNECYIIEAIPLSDKESGYKKRILYVRKDIFLIIKEEYYNKKGELIKIQTFSDIRNLKNNFWRANKIIMDNFKRKHKTILIVNYREINEEIPDSIFTLRELERDE